MQYILPIYLPMSEIAMSSSVAGCKITFFAGDWDAIVGLKGNDSDNIPRLTQ
jgi:hypothetical protein